MVKKTVTYLNPFTDQMVTEDHYFHISKADLVEMEVEEHNATYTKDGETLTGMRAHLQRIVDSEDGHAVLKEFKLILRRAYGKKVGDRFIKNSETWEEFEGSEAYSELVFELLTNGTALAEFINKIVPGNLEEIAKEVAARAESEETTAPKDPTGLTETTTPRVLTQQQVVEMDSDELKAGLADGRYKLS